MGEQFETALRMSELMKATRQCAKGVRWKDSVAAYEDKALLKNYTLAQEIQSGRYKISPYITFKLYEPKERTISATRIRDRVWQRSMCNNGIYEDMTRSLIFDNAACQMGKGTDFSVERLKKQLGRYYRKHGGNKGWAAHLDVRHYFPSTPRSIAKQTLETRISDQDFLQHTKMIVDSYPPSEEKNGAFGPRGISLGCQMSQLVQLANLDHIDHYVKEHMHVDIYVRYMDDFIVVDSDKERLKECVAYIREALGKEGLSLNEKSCMHRLEDGIVYLHRRFILTETGKVVVRFDRAKIAQERRKLKKLKALLDSGKIGMDAVENHYQSWYSSAVKVSSFGMLKSMNKFYTEVFGILPKLKGTK